MFSIDFLECIQFASRYLTKSSRSWNKVSRVFAFFFIVINEQSANLQLPTNRNLIVKVKNKRLYSAIHFEGRLGYTLRFREGIKE